MTDDTKSPTPAIPEAAVEALAREMTIEAYHAGGDAPGVKKSVADAYWREHEALARDYLTIALPYLATPAPADEGTFEHAAAAAWDFVLPKLLEMNREKGPAGIWSNGFRSGWTAAERALVPATSVAEPSEEPIAILDEVGGFYSTRPDDIRALFDALPKPPFGAKAVKLYLAPSRTPPVHPAPVEETPAQEPVEWRYLLFGKGAWKHVYNQGAAEAILAENATLQKKRRHVVEPLYAAPVGERDKALEEAAFDAGLEAAAKWHDAEAERIRILALDPRSENVFRMHEAQDDHISHAAAIRALARSKPTKEGE